MKKVVDFILSIWYLFTVFVVLLVDFGEGLFAEHWDTASFLNFTAAVSFLLATVAALIINSYDPRGDNIDHSHEWVVTHTKQKVKEATEREVYEHMHGYGSWGKKTINTKRLLVLLLAPLVLLSSPYLAQLAGRRDVFWGQGSNQTITICAVLLSMIIYFSIQALLNIEIYKKWQTSMPSNAPIGELKIDYSALGKEALTALVIIGLVIIASLIAIFFYLLVKEPVSIRLAMVNAISASILLLAILTSLFVSIIEARK